MGSQGDAQASGVGEDDASVTWSSKFGFLMAATGSAVGLGNLWRFPYLAGQSGGGLFVAVYILATVFIVLPILVAELMLGRAGGVTPVMAMRGVVDENISSRSWTLIGWGGMVCSVLLLSYYSVIGGWTLRYVFLAACGLFKDMGNAETLSLFRHMTSSPLTLIGYHTLFMLITMLIVTGGVQKGIEKSAMVMMPLLFLVLIGLVAYAATTPKFWTGFSFILGLDASRFDSKALLNAVGQAFFALSVGIGAMMTYGGYLPKSSNILAVSFKIAVADTLVAVLAGLAIFPIVFSHGLPVSEGPGLTFITLPIAFGQMTGGRLFGTAFFVLLMLAAVTSSISALEPFVSFLIARFSLGRRLATWIAGASIWLLGLLTVFSFNLLSWFQPLAFMGIHGTLFHILDFVVANVLLLMVGFFTAVYVGWALSSKTAARYLGISEESFFYKLWRFCLRFLAPVGIVGVFMFECFLS